MPDGVGWCGRRCRTCRLIGFCGAPWTVASYMIEGGSSEERLWRKACGASAAAMVCRSDRAAGRGLVRLSRGQVDAGAEALQIFDSWAGDLTGLVFGETVVEPIERIVQELRRRCPAVPVIVFARGAGSKHGRVAAKRRGRKRLASNRRWSLIGCCEKSAGALCRPGQSRSGLLCWLAASGCGEMVEAIAAASADATAISSISAMACKPGTDPQHLTQVIETMRERGCARQ